MRLCRLGVPRTPAPKGLQFLETAKVGGLRVILTEYTRKVKEFRPGECPNADDKAFRYPAARHTSTDDYDPQVVFATEHIPTSKILRDADIPTEFLQLGKELDRL